MRVDELILLVLGVADGSELEGRTRLQKILYFLCQRLKVDARFSPYYYGPYSEVVARSVDSLVARSLAQEYVRQGPSEGPFEQKRYRYQLTSEGAQVITQLRSSSTSEWRKATRAVRDILEGDPSTRALAVASKLHLIVSRSRRHVRVSELNSKAQRLGWRIDAADIQEGVQFLLHKGLVRTVSSGR